MASALYCFIVLPRNSIVRKNTIAANPVVGRVSFSVSEVSLLKPEVSLLKPEVSLLKPVDRGWLMTSATGGSLKGGDVVYRSAGEVACDIPFDESACILGNKAVGRVQEGVVEHTVQLQTARGYGFE